MFTSIPLKPNVFFHDSLIFKKIGFHLLIYYLHPRILFFFKGSEGNLSAKPWYHTLIIGKSREKKTHVTTSYSKGRWEWRIMIYTLQEVKNKLRVWVPCVHIIISSESLSSAQFFISSKDYVGDLSELGIVDICFLFLLQMLKRITLG